jgi:CheY-like chemotaxis protein
MISVIFKFAAEIFREAIATMPERAKNHLIRMAIVFFGSWSGFGFFFLLGPEMSNLVEKGVMLVGFAICDNISKNVYAWHGWYLRWNILRKHDKPEEFIEEDSKEVKQDYRVLLVETDPMFLYYFENILQHHNCKIDVASTTDVMMKKLEASVELDHEYDIMLVSFAMAKLNGFYLVKQVRTIAFMLPVIAYGRDIKPADMRSRNVSGIDDYIKAPFSDEEISTKMVRWSRRMSVDMTALTRVLTMNDKTRNSMSMPVDDSRDSLQSWEEHPNEGSTPAGHSSGLPMVQEQPIGTRPPEPDPAPNTSLDDPTSSKSLYTKLDLLLQQLEALKANQMRTSSAIEARLQATEMRVQHLSAQSSPRSASPMPMPAFTFTNPVAQPYAPPANPPPMAVPEPRSASPMPMPASTFTNPVARPYAPPANPAPMAVPESLHSPQSNQSLEAQYEALFAQAQEMMKRNQAAPLPPSNFA